MFALVVSVHLDAQRGDEAVKLLNEFTVPSAKGMPGFVRGAWLRSADGRAGRGIVVFDSRQHAEASIETVRQGPPPGSPVTVEDVQLFEVLAEA